MTRTLCKITETYSYEYILILMIQALETPQQKWHRMCEYPRLIAYPPRSKHM